MAAELVETSRLWGRQNAAIDPLWAERLGGDLVKRTLVRAALVEEARVRPGPRAGHPVRRPAGRRPRRTPRQPPARRGPRAVHPARARAGGVARPAPVLRDQPPAARGGGRARAPRPPPRHRGRRGDALRLLRRPGARRGGLRRPLRHLVEAGAPRRARTCSPSTPSMLVHDGRRGSTRATSRTSGTRDRLTLPLSYHFEPGHEADGVTIDVPLATLNTVGAAPFTWNVPGPAARAGDRPDPVAAQAAAGELRARPRRGPPLPRGRAAGGGAAARRAVALPAVAHRRARPRGRLGPRQGARRTCGRPSGSLDEQGARGRRGQGPRGAQAAAAAVVRPRDAAGRPTSPA